MNSRGAVWLIVTIALVVFVILVFVGVMVAQQKGWFKRGVGPENAIPMIELYLRANEADSLGTFFPANVVISYSVNLTDEVKVAEGVLKGDAYVPFMVPADRAVNVRCWDDSHYLVKAVKMFSNQELSLNRSSMDCTTAKVGKLDVSRVSGDLSKDYDIIRLNLTAVNGSYYRLGMCFEWTAGIVRVTSRDQWVSCDSGRWLNYSSYNPETKVYEWLSSGEWKCGDVFEKCDDVKLNMCRLPNVVVPYRFSGLVDSCTYTGKTIRLGESLDVVLEVETLAEKNSLDYLRVFFFDHDRRFVASENRWVWMSANYEKNLGSPDQEFVIPYNIVP